MLSGCVPVTFQLEAAQHQWPLHWISRENALQCTIYLERVGVLKDVTSALQQLLLLAQDMKFLSEKLVCIARVAHRFQYSLPTGGGDATMDAVDVVLNHLLHK